MLIALLETISIVLTFGLGFACAMEWGELWMYLLVVPDVIVIVFFVIFFNVALIRFALVRFRDGTPTLRDGLRFSLSRLPQIFSLFVWLLKLGLAERIQRSDGKALFGVPPEILDGVTVTQNFYFLLPVMVAEGGPPIHAIRRSLLLVCKTEDWPPFNKAVRKNNLMILLAVIPGPVMFFGGSLLAHETDVLIFKVICLLGAALSVVMCTLMLALRAVSSAAMYQHVALREIESECDSHKQ